MKKSTKVLLILFVLTLVPSIVLGGSIIKGITPTGNGFTFSFDVKGIIAISLMVISNILGFILFFRFIMAQPMANAIFFSSLPLMIIYGALMFLLVGMSNYTNITAQSIRTLLNISPDNTYNTILWAVLLTIIFVLFMFLNYFILCRPVGRVEKIVLRLGDGRTREDKLKIGGGKQFNNIEHGLNKINNNFKINLKNSKKVNLEAQKFIPKQFFKLLGKTNIAELELGNQVKKNATLMLVKLVGVEKSFNTIEENFNFLNSYLNVVSPVVRRFGGFIDKYFGEGVLAVFGRSEDAIDCSHAISRAISVKNRQNKSLPNVIFRISIISSEVVFGIVGEEERKLPTIVSSVITELDKFDEVCSFMDCKVVFSDSVLNSLPINYKFVYRHIGSLGINNKTLLFEDLEVLPRDVCSAVIKAKPLFEKGVLCYQKGDYKDACNLFGEALKLAPEDKSCYVYYNKAMEKLD